jgi:hypothetical protein
VKVYVLISSIPSRRHSRERLQEEVAQQSRRPDALILVLDGYGAERIPPTTLPVASEYRSTDFLGPGARWRVVRDLEPDDVVICLDDDIVLAEAPRLVEALVRTMEENGGAAAAMGRTVYGGTAFPGVFSYGQLIHGAGAGLTVRAKHLDGFGSFAEEIRQASSTNMLGPCGDDDALVSAYLWRTGIRLWHAPTGNIYEAPELQATSQGAQRLARGENVHFDSQKRKLAEISGWPWPMK